MRRPKLPVSPSAANDVGQHGHRKQQKHKHQQTARQRHGYMSVNDTAYGSQGLLVHASHASGRRRVWAGRYFSAAYRLGHNHSHIPSVVSRNNTCCSGPVDPSIPRLPGTANGRDCAGSDPFLRCAGTGGEAKPTVRCRLLRRRRHVDEKCQSKTTRESPC